MPQYVQHLMLIYNLSFHLGMVYMMCLYVYILHQNLTKEQTLVVVTHKPALLSLVDRIVIMTEKGIVADDKKEAVLKMLENNRTRQTQQS